MSVEVGVGEAKGMVEEERAREGRMVRVDVREERVRMRGRRRSIVCIEE